MLRALLGSLKHPLILVDWSRIDAPGDAFLLRAAIPLAGRSFPIYESVHERESCPRYQKRLLNTLAELLPRSEEHTSELQSLMRISYAVFCLKQQKNTN